MAAFIKQLKQNLILISNRCMHFWYQSPPPLIADYVRTVLIMESRSELHASHLPLVTSAMPSLFCELEQDEKGVVTVKQLILFGKSAPPDCWMVKENTTLIGYFFKPFALGPIFRISAKELNDKPVDLTALIPQRIIPVVKQMSEADTILKKIEILDGLLINQIEQNEKECKVIKYATDQIMMQPDTESLTRMMATLNLTEKTFQRMFKKYVGITPVQYRRICQHYLSFEQLRGQQFNKMTDIAFDNGYADQSHFIRSFREFTRTTPKDYLRFGLRGKKE